MIQGREYVGRGFIATVVAVVALAFLASACDDDYSTDPEVQGVPSAQECEEGPVPANHGFDIPATLHWISGEHDLGEESSFFLCQQEPIQGSLQISAPDGVAVTPPRSDFDASGSAVLEFKVTVEREVDGYLGFFVNLNGGGVQGGVRGLRVESSEDGWSFAKDESDY